MVMNKPWTLCKKILYFFSSYLTQEDLSRLGRDHLKVGHFTEIYFPMKNVRYIAVNDCVDTANRNNDIAALKNVMNEFY